MLLQLLCYRWNVVPDCKATFHEVQGIYIYIYVPVLDLRVLMMFCVVIGVSVVGFVPLADLLYIFVMHILCKAL